MVFEKFGQFEEYFSQPSRAILHHIGAILAKMAPYHIFCERESKTRSQKIWYLLLKMAQDGSTVAQDGPKMVQDGPARLAKVLLELAEFFKNH